MGGTTIAGFRAAGWTARLSLGIGVAVLALAAGAPQKAAAADDVTLAGGVLTITDATGVNNYVRVSKSNDGLLLGVIDTAGLPATPPPGCTGGGGAIDCPFALVSRVVVNLGGGKDRFGPYGNGTRLPQAVDGGPGRDEIEGGPSADTLKGGTGDDVIRGESGRDLLLGQAGNDRLAGGRDIDKLKCGKGKHDKGVGGPAEDTISGCEDEQR